MKLSLKFIISGLVILALLTTSAGLMFISFQSQKHSTFKLTLDLNQESAMKLGLTMDSLFLSMEKSLEVTASYLKEEPSEEAMLSKLQSKLNYFIENHNAFNSAILVDKEGLIHGSSPENLGVTGKKLRTPQSLRALGSTVPTISPPYMSPTNRLIVLMTYPLFTSSGEYWGFLGGTIYLQEKNILNDIFGDRSPLKTGSYAYVVDDHGNLLFHPDDRRLGENVSSNAVVQRVLRGNFGQMEVQNTQGLDFLAGYHTVSANGWGIVVQTPRSEVTQSLYRLLKNQLMLALPLLLFLMILSVWIAKKVTEPFTNLSTLASDVLRGESVQSYDYNPHWASEVDHIQLNLMLALQDLENKANKLSRDSMTDPLTGLYNRRKMDESLSTWVQERQPFCLIILDIDHFKKINDTFGHQTGDKVLTHLAELIRSETRPGDSCCRFGGEEFAILLPDATTGVAVVIAERIRARMENNYKNRPISTTISCGIARFPEHGSTSREVIQAADRAMYTAKQSGRNQVVTAKEEAQ